MILRELIKEFPDWRDAADWKDNAGRISRGLCRAERILDAVDNLVGLLDGEFDLRDIDASVERLKELLI